MRKFIFGLATLVAVGLWAFVSCRDELVETYEERQSRASVEVIADTVTVTNTDTVGKDDPWNDIDDRKPIDFSVKTEDFNETEIGI